MHAGEQEPTKIHKNTDEKNTVQRHKHSHHESQEQDWNSQTLYSGREQKKKPELKSEHLTCIINGVHWCFPGLQARTQKYESQVCFCKIEFRRTRVTGMFS